MRFIACLVALLSLATAAAAQDRQLNIDQLQSLNSPIGGGDAPIWSPDGSRILFLREQDGGMWTLSPDGGSPSKLVSGVPGGVSSRSNVQLKWSPDGRYIAFVKGTGEGAELFLWSIAEGGAARRLTSLGARVSSYSFSPDGRTIAFAGNRYGSSDIWTVSVPDGRTQRLTTDMREEGYPSWTPDGSTILYTRMDEWWVNHDVYAMPAAGGKARLLLSDKNYFDYRNGASFGFVRPSPDGKSLLFRSQRSGWANYWLAPMAGGVPRQIAAEQADQSEARWSPDGSSILFLSMSNGTQSVKVVPSAGGPARTVAGPAVGMAQRAEWSPSSQQISYMLASPLVHACFADDTPRSVRGGGQWRYAAPAHDGRSGPGPCRRTDSAGKGELGK
jgi:Tol biopolymer transport system component